MIEIELKNVCSKGVGKGNFDLERGGTHISCKTGKMMVAAAIIGDPTRIIGEVEVKCLGCSVAPSFYKILRKKIS